jgi:hypothetical protein
MGTGELERRVSSDSVPLKRRVQARCDGHAYNPSTQEVEAEGSQVQDLPGLHGETLSQKKKKKKD